MADTQSPHVKEQGDQPSGNPVKRRMMIPRNLEKYPDAAYEVADDGFRLWIRENPPIALNDEGWGLLWEYKHFDAPGMSWAFLDHIFRDAPFTTAARQPKAMADQSTEARLWEALKPWADHNGPLPDYDHPAVCVFDSGVQYAVELLAKRLGVETWTPCDGTEEYDGDLGGTLINIVLEAMPKDEQGDPIYPRDVAAELTRLRAEVEARVDLEALCKRVFLHAHSDGWCGNQLRRDTQGVDAEKSWALYVSNGALAKSIARTTLNGEQANG